ncbi:MAG: TetR family transcriptional regulator [Acidimicrobiia bacterium]
MRGLGRRAGTPDTRAEILTAARKVFSEAGYDRATVRSIAGVADVDPSLIYHYYSTKDELFAASIEVPFPPIETLESVFAGERGEVGLTLAQTFFTVWEQQEARASLLGILRSAMGGEDQAVAAFREFLTATILEHVAPLIPGEQARLRALLMASHLVGVAMTRYVMRLEPIATAPIEELVALIAPRIQSYVDDGAS